MKVVTAALACAFVVAGGGAAALATSYPGANGQVLYLGEGGLVAVNPDGTAARTIVRDRNAEIDRFAWSADGRRIAYTKTDGTLHVTAADGAGDTQIASQVLGWPSWSPDGSEIAVTNTASALVAVNVATHAVRTILSGPTDDPSWSPAGRIIFIRDVLVNGQRATAVATINADGSGYRVLATSQPNEILERPTLSPDGSKLLVSTFAPPSVLVMNSDGSGRRTLIPFAQLATWSPDSQHILATTVSFTDGGLSSYSLDGTREQKFGGNPGDWQPCSSATACRLVALPPKPKPKPKPCKVPDVFSQPLSYARRLIVDSRCRVGRVSYASPPRSLPHREVYRRGLIIAQKPKRGTVLKAGSRVDLVLSNGKF